MAPSLLVGESDDKKEQYEEFNENAKVAVTCGFYFDTTNVEAEVAAIQTVYDEYQNLLEWGFYDPDVYLPQFQEALKKAGIEKVMAELQEQYDAWLLVK
jgi:putative aldouronate transport system substrate-binding protein